MRIAMIGTRGVPARYGGFETCIEEVGSRLADRGHDVTVYCRSHNVGAAEKLDRYLGMKLVHLPAVKKRSMETLSHTALSVAHAVRARPDVAFVFNSANAPFLPALSARNIPVATHVDGLEWQRDKWSGTGREYYRRAETLAVRFSDALIADAQGISDYYMDQFNAKTTIIAYGAPIIEKRRPELLTSLGLTPRGYHLVVARFEPENHVDVIVDGYVRSNASQPLVVVGSAPYSEAYTQRVHHLADSRVTFLGGVWDQELLDQLYANATSYLHGHSVGGTNPSLLRAIGAGAPTVAFDVVFNREVLGEAGTFFHNAPSLTEQVEQAEANTESWESRSALSVQRAKLYDWDDVAGRYEDLAFRLVRGEVPGRIPSSRRKPQEQVSQAQPRVF